MSISCRQFMKISAGTVNAITLAWCVLPGALLRENGAGQF